MYILITSAIGYLFGCIHGSQLVGMYKKINIKTIGSKNAGATNATMTLGWKYGFIVAFIDIFKAIVSISLIILLLNKVEIINEAQMVYLYINAFFVILGHNYPLPMNFRGGKGTASFFGLLLVIDWKIAFMGLAIILLLAIITDYLAIGVLFMYISFFAFSYYSFGMTVAMISFGLLLVSIIKHIDNYKRIIKNEEIRFSSIYQKEVS